jgi:hypothetical protein
LHEEAISGDVECGDFGLPELELETVALYVVVTARLLIEQRRLIGRPVQGGFLAHDDVGGRKLRGVERPAEHDRVGQGAACDVAGELLARQALPADVLTGGIVVELPALPGNGGCDALGDGFGGGGEALLGGLVEPLARMLSMSCTASSPLTVFDS